MLAEEAARIADRLDELDRIIAGDGVLWLLRFRRMDESGDGSELRPIVIEVKIDNVLSEARQQATALAGILVKLGATGAAARPVGKPAEPAAKPGQVVGLTAVEKARAARDARIAGA